MNDFDKYEEEEAARRVASFDRDALIKKSQKEQAKHDAGIGVETEPQEDEEDEDED